MTDARREPVTREEVAAIEKAYEGQYGESHAANAVMRLIWGYRALADRLAASERERDEARKWKGHHDAQVTLKRKLHDINTDLRKQLTDAQATIARLEKAGTWPDIIAPAQYENPAAGWEDAKLPDLRTIWSVARECGYAVGVHGSLKRDVDLIAAPWTDEAVGNAELIDRLCAALNATRIDGPERKPFGRRAVVLQIDGYYKPIDLSIMPRSTAEQQVARLREIATKAIDDEPEMPGEMPNELYQTVHELDREGLAEWCRIMVRATKRGITERLEHALRKTGADSGGSISGVLAG